jgi:hypothetical protein
LTSVKKNIKLKKTNESLDDLFKLKQKRELKMAKRKKKKGKKKAKKRRKS